MELCYTECLAATVNDGVWRGIGGKGEKSRIISTFATGGLWENRSSGNRQQLSETRHKDMGFRTMFKEREDKNNVEFGTGSSTRPPAG